MRQRPDRSSPAPRIRQRGDLRIDNVILIITDSMRRDALSPYGSDWIRTPHLDRFSRQAVLFENAFLSSFPTVPCRNDILTGRYTFTYKDWSPLDPDAITLQETLGKAGILTSLIADTPHPFTPGYNYQRDFDAWQVNRGQEADAFRSAPRTVKLPCNPGKLRGGGEDGYTVPPQRLSTREGRGLFRGPDDDQSRGVAGGEQRRPPVFPLFGYLRPPRALGSTALLR